MALETAGNLYANDLFKPKLLPKKCNEYIYIYILTIRRLDELYNISIEPTPIKITTSNLTRK